MQQKHLWNMRLSESMIILDNWSCDYSERKEDVDMFCFCTDALKICAFVTQSVI